MVCNENIRQEVNSLTIPNPFLFANVLKDYPDLCRRFLEQTFNLQIGELDYLGYENVFENFSDCEDTRTEIYAHEKNTTRFFTIEMPDNPDDDFGKKLRCYRALMDKDSYQRINAFADLYIVFVCPFDVFKEGHHLYKIKNRCKEDSSIEYDDGCYQVFLCGDSTEDDVNDEVRAFLDFLLPEGLNQIRIRCLQRLPTES